MAQRDPHTDIASYRLNRSRDWISKKKKKKLAHTTIRHLLLVRQIVHCHSTAWPQHLEIMPFGAEDNFGWINGGLFYPHHKLAEFQGQISPQTQGQRPEIHWCLLNAFPCILWPEGKGDFQGPWRFWHSLGFSQHLSSRRCKLSDSE